MIALLLASFAMTVQPSLDPEGGETFEQRLRRACVHGYDGEEEYVDVQFYLDRTDLLIAPLKYIYGAISEVDWLTKRKETVEGVCQAIRALAVNGSVWVFRITVEEVEHEGKRYYQVVILYDA